ncbi:hypothetical protein DRH14_00140 [Candidatus Shapirobacteria bacterium]|nr:MAG: hypothetical protein DRH14_00140 [Candidatus Shapirobacteria bacterium]
MPTNKKNHKKTNTLSLPDNTVSALTYSLTLLSGLIIFLLEKDNKTIRFHALQAIILGVLWMVLPKLFLFTLILAPLAILLNLVFLVIWIILIVKTYKGENFDLPIISNWVRKQLK